MSGSVVFIAAAVTRSNPADPAIKRLAQQLAKSSAGNETSPAPPAEVFDPCEHTLPGGGL